MKAIEHGRMSKTIKLSVIIATRNRSKPIIECLNSIAASIQASSHPETEILAIDSASTDDTAVTIQNWIKTNEEINARLIKNEIKGTSLARNTGILNASGNTLIFLDDDCQMEPEYIENCHKLFTNDKSLTLRGGRVILGDETDMPISIRKMTEPKTWNRSQDPESYLTINNALLGCNMACPKTLFDDIGLFDERLGPGTRIPGAEDTDITQRAFYKNWTIKFAPEIVAKHFHGRKEKSEATKIYANYSEGTGALYAKNLFKNLEICKHFYWDLKHLTKEITSRKNIFRPDINFSYKSKIKYNLIGFVKYVYSNLIDKTVS